MRRNYDRNHCGGGRRNRLFSFIPQLDYPRRNSETKSAASPKGGASNDTVSVILHDNFYSVDTCAYVTGWEPEKYASYTCQWIRSANVGAPENNITMIDSVAILRVQYAEFSFDYYIRFEVAHYNDGSYSCLMPHYSPIVTDLGAQELEDLQTFVKDGNVYARKLLKHSIRVVIGNTPYVLNAVDTLYRHLPDANPSKFVLWSEVLSEEIPTELVVVTDEYSLATSIYYPYKCKFKQHYSDGSADVCEIDISNNKLAYLDRWSAYVTNDNAHCDNVLSLYNVASSQAVYTNTNTIGTGSYYTINEDWSTLEVSFSGDGVGEALSNTRIGKISIIYDDGYTFCQKSFAPICEYSHKEKECNETTNKMYVKMFFNYTIENLQHECYTCQLWFSHI